MPGPHLAGRLAPMTPPAAEAAASQPSADEQLALVDAYWRAANYLAVDQIYLQRCAQGSPAQSSHPRQPCR